MWVRWDSQWFLEIARRGYWLRDGLPLPQAFFPLYPLLIRLLSPLFGGQTYLAGLFVANAGFLLGLAALYRLVAERWGSRVAARAACYLILFPAGFYLSAVYSEGLFFGCAAGAFYFAGRRRWAAAGLCGLAAALTRNLGVFLFFPMLGEWVAARNAWEEPPPRPASPGRYHNAYRPPYRRVYSALDLLALGGTAALLAAGWRLGLPRSWLLFGFLGLALPLLAPALRSMTPLPSSWRYVAVLFPAHAALALLAGGGAADRAVRAAFAALQGFFFLLFTTWNWIA